MPQLLTQASKLKCPHLGTVKIKSSSTVKAAGNPVATMKDVFVISGCQFKLPTVPTPTPHPCVLVMWIKPMKLLVNGVPALDQASVGLCIAADMLPQGPVIITSTQPKVKGL